MFPITVLIPALISGRWDNLIGVCFPFSRAYVLQYCGKCFRDNATQPRVPSQIASILAPRNAERTSPRFACTSGRGPRVYSHLLGSAYNPTAIAEMGEGTHRPSSARQIRGVCFTLMLGMVFVEGAPGGKSMQAILKWRMKCRCIPSLAICGEEGWRLKSPPWGIDFMLIWRLPRGMIDVVTRNVCRC